jgi:formate dehydrogenase maturation protein FdhE
VSRKRGERSPVQEVEDLKILKSRLRSLERENQRLRKELRKRAVVEVPTDESIEDIWTSKEAPKQANYKCPSCGSMDTSTLLDVTIRNGARKVHISCNSCGKRGKVG